MNSSLAMDESTLNAMIDLIRKFPHNWPNHQPPMNFNMLRKESGQTSDNTAEMLALANFFLKKFSRESSLYSFPDKESSKTDLKMVDARLRLPIMESVREMEPLSKLTSNPLDRIDYGASPRRPQVQPNVTPRHSNDPLQKTQTCMEESTAGWDHTFQGSQENMTDGKQVISTRSVKPVEMQTAERSGEDLADELEDGENEIPTETGSGKKHSSWGSTDEDPERDDRSGLSAECLQPSLDRTDPSPNSAMLPFVRRKKKTRTVFSRSQVHHLETTFNLKRYLSSSERVALAKALQLTETQVKIWFQNRRNKWKRQSVNEFDTTGGSPVSAPVTLKSGSFYAPSLVRTGLNQLSRAVMETDHVVQMATEQLNRTGASNYKPSWNTALSFHSNAGVPVNSLYGITNSQGFGPMASITSLSGSPMTMFPTAVQGNWQNSNQALVEMTRGSRHPPVPIHPQPRLLMNLTTDPGIQGAASTFNRKPRPTETSSSLTSTSDLLAPLLSSLAAKAPEAGLDSGTLLAALNATAALMLNRVASKWEQHQPPTKLEQSRPSAADDRTVNECSNPIHSTSAEFSSSVLFGPVDSDAAGLLEHDNNKLIAFG